MNCIEEFRNKVIIVTGSAGGLGKETALRFANSGAKVVIADIKREYDEDGVRYLIEINDDRPIKTDSLKDMKGEEAPPANPLIKNLIKEGKIVEVYIDKKTNKLKANRVNCLLLMQMVAN